MKSYLMMAVCVALLAGCGDKAQYKAAGTTNRDDAPPWQGAKNAYVAKGWTPGNQSAWETQLRTRAQYQNEYVKVN
jgi:hypothetical protein